MSRAKPPMPLGIPGLRVTELEPYCQTEVYCNDCDWTQRGMRGYHVISASSIRRHLTAHPGHTIEAKVRGIEQFTLDPAAASGAAAGPRAHEMPREGTSTGGPEPS